MKIPFGSILILIEDVWHGGLSGGVGNVRLHGAIIAMAIKFCYHNLPLPLFPFLEHVIFLCTMQEYDHALLSPNYLVRHSDLFLDPCSLHHHVPASRCLHQHSCHVLTILTMHY